MAAVLQALEAALGGPVDIEFASDGQDFYLLQCRPQSASDDDAPSPIPRDVADDRIIFRADRHVSNGRVPDLTHIVYVVPETYGMLPERSDYLEVGTVIAELNKLLPKRRFALLGPGRWGSRGDVRLGVSVGYSDINNTAMLVEIARTSGGYRPDLSFGTHFFQDLVESRIRYLPLYPDEGDGRLNERFLLQAQNLLPELLPERGHLADVVRVVDVSATSHGLVLRVLLNAELDLAVGLLVAPGDDSNAPPPRERAVAREQSDQHWRWRMTMAENIARTLDPDRFGVVALYVIGSTKNATAGPASDIDLLVHVLGSDSQLRELEAWLEGWSHALAESNYLRTGYQQPDLLDVHFVTDDDLRARTSFAAKIGAVTDAARKLSLGNQ
jgi:predicted nucleotidyltransferase